MDLLAEHSGPETSKEKFLRLMNIVLRQGGTLSRENDAWLREQFEDLRGVRYNPVPRSNRFVRGAEALQRETLETSVNVEQALSCKEYQENDCSGDD